MSEPQKIRILLADDHPFIRAGIKSVLEREIDIFVVAEASDGDQVLILCNQHPIDILILDIHMPGPNTREIVTRLQRYHPKISIIILSAFDDDVYIRTLSTLGVKGYVLKDEAMENLVVAVQAVYEGRTWFSQKIIKKILTLNLEKKPIPASERELKILKMVRDGQSYEEISRILEISYRTVRFHMANIQDKLGAKNRIDAITKAVERGWID